MLITWEDKLHDKMMSAYSKSCGYKKFSVHTNTKKYRFQIVPLWRAFSKSYVFVDLFMRISVDGSCIRNNKVAFSNLSGIVWTGPQINNTLTEVSFDNRSAALQQKPKTRKKIFPLVTKYNATAPNFKEILLKNSYLIQNQPELKAIFPQPPIVSYKKTHAQS